MQPKARGRGLDLGLAATPVTTLPVSIVMATQNQTWPENHFNQNLRSNPSTMSVSLAGWQNDRALEILICFCFLCSLHQLP